MLTPRTGARLHGNAPRTVNRTRAVPTLNVQPRFSLFREANDGSSAFALDATFCLRAPFAGRGPRSRPIESESYPGYFLVRSEAGVSLAESTDTTEFRAAASWRLGQLEP